MAWAGTGVVWSLAGGALTSCELGAGPARPKTSDIFFVQISDSHIGFHGPANTNVTDTFQRAIDMINGLPARPAFVLHTGDLTHLSTPEQFDTVRQMTGTIKTGRVLLVPGEHDAISGDDKLYLEMFGKGTRGTGWSSFDHSGVHFVGLVNAVATQGMGHLGAEQLSWLKKDLAGVSSETPVVVFAHVPLYALYPAWGWSTDDANQALGYLRRFGSVTVLNGHIHQVMSKVEGNVSFYTARSTAFVQPAPGKAAGPGPMAVPQGTLSSVLGIREARFVARQGHVAVKDDTEG
jgi:3',5'-cyclic AMP phosphodiesterase CpdA